jgi:predicted TPR repeat methyltransferase
VTQGQARRSSPAETARFYDQTAQETGWLAPQVAFGLMYGYVEAGQSLLDLGIGTGLSSVLFRKAGLRVVGMDADTEMLDACRGKGFPDEDLVQHDLTLVPYPFSSGAFDHAACLGVLPFLGDVAPVFAETARVLRPGGMFAFLTLDRAPGEPADLVVPADETGTGQSATLVRHSLDQIQGLLGRHGFTLDLTLPLPVYRDTARSRCMPAICYLARATVGS